MTVPLLLKDLGEANVRAVMADGKALDDFSKIFSAIQPKDLNVSALATLVKKQGASVVWLVLGSRRFGIENASAKEKLFVAFMDAFKAVKMGGDYAKDNADDVKIAFNNARNALIR